MTRMIAHLARRLPGFVAGLIGLGWVVMGSVAAEAGMPSLTLADVRRELALSNLTRMRLETISFFLIGLLLCAVAVRAVWNGLRRDFPRLPKLTYAKALGVVGLWGLLFVLVLTMISGARELMTPGAWEKKGLTYQLVEETASPIERQITERYRGLERLGVALKAYAASHNEAYPPIESMNVIDDSLWIAPESGGQRYVYRGGQGWPLAYEPDGFGADRLVLRIDGAIQWMSVEELEQLTKGRAH